MFPVWIEELFCFCGLKTITTQKKRLITAKKKKEKKEDTWKKIRIE